MMCWYTIYNDIVYVSGTGTPYKIVVKHLSTNESSVEQPYRSVPAATSASTASGEATSFSTRPLTRDNPSTVASVIAPDGPACNGASSETNKEFKLKAHCHPFHTQSLKLGVLSISFNLGSARVKFAPPYRWIHGCS